MTLDRRLFLKGAAATGAGATAAILLKYRDNDNADPTFSGLWDILLEYNSARNKDICRNLGLPGSDQTSSKEAWKKTVSYCEKNYPELIISRQRKNDINLMDLKTLCRENNKIYSQFRSLSNLNMEVVLLGDIKSEYPMDFSFNNQKISSMIVEFVKDAPTITDVLKRSDRIAWMNASENTAYVDLSSIKDSAKTLYKPGNREYNDDFSMQMAQEVSSAVIEEAEKRHPLIGSGIMPDFIRYFAFKEAFVEASRKISIDHELMHYFEPWPRGNSPKSIIEGIRNEKKPFLYSAWQSPEYSSMIFLSADARFRFVPEAGKEPIIIRYDSFWKAFEDIGYDKKRLMEITPKQRGELAGRLISDD